MGSLTKFELPAGVQKCAEPQKMENPTRNLGPLIKSQMLYRLSYERIFRSKTILPNNITTIDCKKQEQRRKKRKFPRKRPDLRRERFSGAQHSAEAGARRL